jgi:hypothetical protein
MSRPFSVYTTSNGSDANAPKQDGLAITSNGTYYSDMWTGRLADGYGLTVLTTGTLTGTFTLWMTDKPFPNLANDSDWVQDTTFAPTNPAGAGVSFRDDAGNAKAFHKRLKLVVSGGTGTAFAYVNVPRTA